MNHGQPEVHGCGAEAKTSARRTMIREGKIYPGSGVPDKKPDPIRRGQLEKLLDKKLTKLGDSRKKKKDDEKS